MHFPLRSTVVLALVLGACGKAEDTEPWEPALVFDETGDTAPPYDPLGFGNVIAAEMRLTARFGWDQALGEIVMPPSIDGDSNSSGASEIYVTLYAEGWQDASDSDLDKMICHVGVELQGLTATDNLDDGFFWGVEVPYNTDMLHETCSSVGFDMSQFLNGDAMEQYGDQNWKLQLGGAIEESTATWLTDVWGEGDDFDINHYAGAQISADSFTSDYEDNWFSGWDMDPNSYDVDSTYRLLNSEHDDGGELRTGYYLFDQNIYRNVSPVDKTE